MLIDKFGRKIDYLRISVTDRCNLRCSYCMPEEGIVHKPHSQILTFEGISKIVKVAAGLGIEKVRITGGEPLVRKDLPKLIATLKGIAGLKEIALTTNGINLSEYAQALKNSGLDRINISLDTLVPEKFKRITRGGNIKLVLGGITSALSMGLAPLKVNTVLLNGFNTNEIIDFVSLARDNPVEVRFIEYMPTGLADNLFFSCTRAKEICSSLGELIPLESKKIQASRTFQIKGFLGSIGFISPLSQPFCFYCNKLRLTSDGKLKSCLHSARAVDLKPALEKGGRQEDLVSLIKQAAAFKPASHNLQQAPLAADTGIFSMCQIGG